MSLTKVLQKYFSNIFISIVQQNNEWIIFSKVVKNGVIKDKFLETFERPDRDNIPSKMEKYLEKLQTDYNFAYVTVFLDSMGQGAINGITAADFEKNSVDMKSVTHIDIDKSWSAYASFIDINWVKKLFKNSGLDFIYSPFIVQNSLIKQAKLKEKPTLYILNHNDSVTISVFENGSLLFGAYFQTTTDDKLGSGDEDWENETEEEGIDDLVELENISNNDMGGLDELDDLNELDDLDDDNMSTDFEEIDEGDKDLGHFNDEQDNSDLELFGRDVLIYKFLTSSIKEFYKNPLFKSSFIETIVLHDGYEVSSELIDMIENDLLMDIEMNKIDISEVVCNISIKEVLK